MSQILGRNAVDNDMGRVFVCSNVTSEETNVLNNNVGHFPQIKTGFPRLGLYGKRARVYTGRRPEIQGAGP